MADQTLVQPPPQGIAVGRPPAPVAPQESFVQRNRTAVYAGGGLLVLIAGYLAYRHFSGSSSTASPSTSGTQDQTALYPYTGGYGGTETGQTLASQIASEEQAIAGNTQTFQSGLAGVNGQLVDLNASQSGQTQQLGTIERQTSGIVTAENREAAGTGRPSNPFPVGFKRGNEVVVTSLWDPQENSFFSETNQGGIWTSRGLPLTGSAYGHGTFRPGSLQILPGGKSFVETNTNGQKFQYAVR